MADPLVLILYNHPLLPVDHPDAESEHTIVDIAGKLGGVLTEDGLRVSLLGLAQDPTVLWQEIQRHRPALIFNLFEGNLGNTDTESYVAGLLEWSGIPFTGSPFLALSLARHKHLAKLLLRGHGLPTADFMVVDKLPVPDCKLSWPVIVKPASQDASVGLDQRSVVSDQGQLEARVDYLLKNYGGTVLVEEYVPGREFNVALTELPELRCLPPAEMVFRDEGPGVWPILTYDAKWRMNTPEYGVSVPEYPARISAELSQELCGLAESAYRLLGLRDYARVDFRVHPSGQPYILEVNPNPEISDAAGFAGCLGAAGIQHRDFIVQMVRFALQRRPV